MARTHVICFGNELHGDDGLGPRVYAELRDLPWPGDVAVFNAGIAGIDALRYLEDCARAVLVDASCAGAEPGSVRVLGREQLQRVPCAGSAHGVGVEHLLAMLEALGAPVPAMRVVAVEAAAIRPFHPGLSEAVEHAIPEAVRVVRELALQ